MDGSALPSRASCGTHRWSCAGCSRNIGTIEPDTIIDGRYKLGEQLGAGGMGTVHLAERVKLGRAVAIKFLRPAFARQTDFVRRFEREALAMSRIYHPHCVSIIDYGMHEDSPYLVMEMLVGETLREKLGDNGRTVRLPIRKAMDYAQHLDSCLAAANEMGIVHRDLKPDNVFVTKDGRL